MDDLGNMSYEELLRYLLEVVSRPDNSSEDTLRDIRLVNDELNRRYPLPDEDKNESKLGSTSVARSVSARVN